LKKSRQYNDQKDKKKHRKTNEEMLRALGADFTSFVQNLDALHAHLSRTYTKLVYPSFRFVKQLDEHP
jgi:F420-0:gamma-glutamyl ligase-like protein